MIYFEHRKNKISELEAVDPKNGVEIDLRSSVHEPGKIHLAHDPWTLGDDFDLWLKKYAELKIRGTIILNTKEDSLEEKAMELLKKHGLDNYIFLDTTVPTFVKWTKKGIPERFFLRISKYEDLDGILKFKGKVEWLWVDCFDLETIPEDILKKAQESFKLCLVSPELQGGTEADFAKFQPQIKYFSGVCTKKPFTWQGLLHEN